MPRSLVGKSLGQYKLVEIIGSGGLATVYKGFQTSLERWVAVKVLHSSDRIMLARFKREAKAVAKLRHRNILMVYEYDERDGIPYIAMEYVEGGTLAGRLQGEPLEWPTVASLSVAVAEALHYAHQHGLIHRDVKPSNILMAEDDWPLLADFGLVKVKETLEPLTESGEIMGTPGYIPPEQAVSKPATPRSDMYSLGVIMFEMITGRLPFKHRSPHAVLLSHISEEIPSPVQYNADCPEGLAQVIIRAMQKSPEDRFPTMGEMVAALQQLMQGAGVPFTTSSYGTRRLQTLAATPPETPPETPVPRSTTFKRPRLMLTAQNTSIELPDRPELIIGRAHGAKQVDIDLTPYDAVEAGISRRHARLFQQDDDWLIDDLGSLNGTYVNNEKVEPGQPVKLDNSDVIRCSLMSFIFLTGSSAS